MKDTGFTSAELQESKPSIAFLPIGACEQHFDILPLDTDVRQSRWLAREIASGVEGSYLLPALAFGTSLENTGAPGTVTLMPGTLAAVVRDIVDSLYRQGFELVVIVNSHGGNFAVRPAVREINYRNPGRKTIFVDPWEIVPGDVKAGIFEGVNELHCGEIEVSVMLHIDPEAVRVENLRDGDPGAARAELDMFSLPFLSGGEPWGLASRATAEKGRRFCREMISHSVEFIGRMVRLHREHGSYHG